MYSKIVKILRIAFVVVCFAGCCAMIVHFGGIVVDAVRNFPDVISGDYQIPLISVASFRCVAIFLFSMTVALTILLNKEE